MACCDTRSVIASLLIGLLFQFVISEQFKQSDQDLLRIFSGMGWIFLIYGVIGSFYRICVCIDAWCKKRQERTLHLQQQQLIYAYGFHQPIIQQPPNHNNYQQINESNLINEFKLQKKQNMQFDRLTIKINAQFAQTAFDPAGHLLDYNADINFIRTVLLIGQENRLIAQSAGQLFHDDFLFCLGAIPNDDSTFIQNEIYQFQEYLFQ